MDTATLDPYRHADNRDVVWALRTLTDRAAAYRAFLDYYEGRHRLAFASSKFANAFAETLKAVAYNRCPSVVDAIANRLQIVGWEDEEGDDGEGDEDGGAETPSFVDEAEAVWRENRMDRRQGEVFQEAGISGDAYVIVWPVEGDDGAPRPRIYPNDALDVCVRFDAENPGRVVLAAKAWRDDDGHWRLNLYYPTKLEKYRTEKRYARLPLSEKLFGRYQPAGDAEWPLAYPWDWEQVPVFHFGSSARTGRLGRSELADVVPLQDALNKSVCDMLVAMEFAAFPQRWMTGLTDTGEETETDPVTGLQLPVKSEPPYQPGVDRIWATDAPDAKFGQFQAADLDAFLKVHDSFDMKIARVSQVPIHYVMQSGTPPSGESLKTAEAPFVAKLEDRQDAFGPVWNDVMAFCLRLLDYSTEEADRVAATWKPAESRSDTEFWTVAQLKADRGVPDEQIQTEAGYTKEQREAFAAAAEEKRDAAQLEAVGQALAFSRGTGLDDDDEEENAA